MERDRAIVLKTQQRGVSKTVELLIYICARYGLEEHAEKLIKQEYHILRDHKYVQLQFVIV